ncbi:CD99 molecule isoform X5 [Paramormyrops kingsleyae]|uniref:CD99 molecule isoform X5 n=1 Tax=Paramormyrops kingsleyae TaxID=1676925 RepID=UPI000CD63B32|nr:CD99 antigen-like protein 2 isoform X4 [Paramormyrops kingsleyae]
MKLYVWIFLLAGFAFRASAQELNLLDAFGEDDVTPTPKPPAKPPKKTPEDELDLSDALGPADPKTEKPKIVRPNDGGTGGGTFGDDDLFDLSQNEGYKPDAGKGGQGGGRIADPSGGGGASQPQDLELLWDQILKQLSHSMPESLLIWIDNFKQTVAPLLERIKELLDMSQ